MLGQGIEAKAGSGVEGSQGYVRAEEGTSTGARIGEVTEVEGGAGSRGRISGRGRGECRSRARNRSSDSCRCRSRVGVGAGIGTEAWVRAGVGLQGYEQRQR